MDNASERLWPNWQDLSFYEPVTPFRRQLWSSVQVILGRRFMQPVSSGALNSVHAICATQPMRMEKGDSRANP